MRWTRDHVPALGGRVAVVTGANSGLGLIASRELARAGARVVMACRDTARGRWAVEHVRAGVPGADVELARLDLADLGSVRYFAADYASRYGGLDLLVNNAGVMAVPYRLTADGFELQFGVNHLGHFALTGHLLPRLLARPAPRAVTVTSFAYRIGRLDFADLQSRRRYYPWLAYAQSKLANLLFAYELQRRAAAAGFALRSMAVHPGYAATNLQLVGPRMAGDRLRERVYALTNSLLAQSDEMGALPLLYAATEPGLAGGSLVGPSGLFGARGYPAVVDSSAAAKDPQTAEQLWDVSTELTGVHFNLALR